jgi:hypothetical protein
LLAEFAALHHGKPQADVQVIDFIGLFRAAAKSGKIAARPVDQALGSPECGFPTKLSTGFVDISEKSVESWT